MIRVFLKEVLKNPMMKECIKTGALERFVQLDRLENGKRVFKVFDGQGNRL